MDEDEIKMVKNEKGNPTPIQSLGKFEEPNARFGFSLRMTTEYDEYYDKKDIAIMIRDSTLDCELSCSLIEDQIVNDCCGCSLKFICDKIDKVAESYIEETTRVVSTFRCE